MVMIYAPAREQMEYPKCNPEWLLIFAVLDFIALYDEFKADALFHLWFFETTGHKHPILVRRRGGDHLSPEKRHQVGHLGGSAARDKGTLYRFSDDDRRKALAKRGL